MRRWLHRPEGSNWGEFGADDQIGRMNLVTPERRRQAIAEAREGLAFLLGLPLDHPRRRLVPGRSPPVLCASNAGGKLLYDWQPHRSTTDVVNDDTVTLSLQFSTQWDGLSHYGAAFDADGDGEAEHVFYNGFRADTHFTLPREGVGPHAHALGIEQLAQTCVQGRGVLVDLRHAHGDGEGRVGYDMLMRAMERQGADVGPGDFLCLRTGYADLLLTDGAAVDVRVLNACPGLDGRDQSLLSFIERSGLAAICADNAMVEKSGSIEAFGGTAMLPLHEHCLFRLGIHLGELWWFGAIGDWLAENDRAHFLLTAPPLNLPGAVGSPVSPVGTV